MTRAATDFSVAGIGDLATELAFLDKRQFKIRAR